MAISEISSAIRDPQQLKTNLGISLAKIGDVTLDVIIRETPQHTWTVTSHKTEEGYEINDLRIREPITLVLDVVMVDKQYGVKDLISNGITGEGYSPETWRDKYGAIKELWQANEPVTVVTGLDSYDNMVIQNLSPLREASNAGSFMFSITLKEVRIVDSEFVDVDNSLMPQQEETSEQKTVKKKKGKKKPSKTKPSKPTEKQNSSVLYNLTR